LPRSNGLVFAKEKIALVTQKGPVPILRHDVRTAFQLHIFLEQLSLPEPKTGEHVIFSQGYQEESEMHKDEAKGVGKQVKGAIKDAVGGMTGNERMQAEGKADKAVGKAQQKVGEMKDKASDALKR
jgi:uncharacterized protein YjbJ (UPF0337 family)